MKRLSDSEWWERRVAVEEVGGKLGRVSTFFIREGRAVAVEYFYRTVFCRAFDVAAKLVYVDAPIAHRLGR